MSPDPPGMNLPAPSFRAGTHSVQHRKPEAVRTRRVALHSILAA